MADKSEKSKTPSFQIPCSQNRRKRQLVARDWCDQSISGFWHSRISCSDFYFYLNTRSISSRLNRHYSQLATRRDDTEILNIQSRSTLNVNKHCSNSCLDYYHHMAPVAHSSTAHVYCCYRFWNICAGLPTNLLLLFATMNYRSVGCRAEYHNCFIFIRIRNAMFFSISVSF
jgi:hypothetical protein